MELKNLLGKLSSNLVKAKDYLEKRRLTSDIQSLMNMGFMDNELFYSLSQEDRELYALTNQEGGNKYKDRITFPCYTYDGIFCGFIGRSIHQDVPFKYLLPSHILFSKETFIYNFNAQKDTDTIFVSENMIECGRVQQCGFQSVSFNGAYKSLFKVLILPLNFKRIIFILDNDSAGKELKSYIKIILEGFTKVSFDFLHHNEKGFDEFFVKNGLEASKKLLEQYVH